MPTLSAEQVLPAVCVLFFAVLTRPFLVPETTMPYGLDNATRLVFSRFAQRTRRDVSVHTCALAVCIAPESRDSLVHFLPSKYHVK